MVFFVCNLLVSSGDIQGEGNLYVRNFTKRYEFNLIKWTTGALVDKIILKSLNISDYLSLESKEIIIDDYLNNKNKLNDIRIRIYQIYSDPFMIDSEKPVKEVETIFESLKRIDSEITPLVEEILESQIIAVFFENRLAIYGQPFPPLLFKISELPENLIVSPRDRIEQIESVSLTSQLETKDMENLESTIDSELNVSSLVVPIGGLGMYPTMIGASSSLPWLINTIAHEWTHNWLVFHPLGWNYGKSNDLRTMNETTASIIGSEIELLVLKKYYPNKYNEIIQATNELNTYTELNALNINPFDFSAEMYITRIHVDSLLSIGNVPEAEGYMEIRRQDFWDNGYLIRKINQAYFAFYGAYADIPGGATGNDPVGPAVRKFREQSESISEFLLNIAKLSSFSELIQIVE